MRVGCAWLDDSRWDTKAERLWIYNCEAHNQGGVWGCIPVIVLDVYEHAYFIDFGADKKKYIEAFWTSIGPPRTICSNGSLRYAL